MKSFSQPLYFIKFFRFGFNCRFRREIAFDFWKGWKMKWIENRNNLNFNVWSFVAGWLWIMTLYCCIFQDILNQSLKGGVLQEDWDIGKSFIARMLQCFYGLSPVKSLLTVCVFISSPVYPQTQLSSFPWMHFGLTF